MSAKRQQLVDTALAHFYRSGIHATGINDLLGAAGVAKKTLYSHFAGKEELVLAALAERDKRFYDWLRARLTATAPGEARLEALFLALDDWFNDRVPALAPFLGCFFINACGEYSEAASPVHQACRAHKVRILALLETELASHCPGADARALAEALQLLKEGAISRAHVEGDRDAALAALPLARLLWQRP
ncbi:TetR/AcrR family transcriptional regulator [Gallaecimonas sp. GXIMD4217]|uniref:TetR/AcrR family transcriptional regulator n=1 Tax=Gallaecimonas sp. GXIMD4217 TaxID=3131927 RepID=UPI00311B2BF6